MFVGIDRASKSPFARLVESAGKMEAAALLRDLVEAVPDAIHTVLTDNGIQFTNRARDIDDSQHIFSRVCNEHEIEHRLTKVNHPWTNGQVERMNRTSRKRLSSATITEATANCAPTSNSSSMPTTMPAASQRCVSSRPTSSPAGRGPKNQNGSDLTRYTTLRDQTPNLLVKELVELATDRVPPVANAGTIVPFSAEGVPADIRSIASQGRFWAARARDRLSYRARPRARS